MTHVPSLDELRERASVLYKSVDYSYPTSENANRFGFRNGCFTVSRHDYVQPPTAIAGFETREQAVEYARSLALPWSPIYLRFHPNES